MSAKKGLGRGFESLIPTDLLDEAFDPTAKQDEQVSTLRELPLSQIAPNPEQPRRDFDGDSLDELAASIREHGVLQPIIVTPRGNTHVIVAGERRYRAAQQAGLEAIPVLIRTLSDQHQLEISLIENLRRQDLNPIETATAYIKLRDQFNLTLDEIGQRVGNKSAGTVSNTIRLLRLPASVRAAIAEGKLTEGQVRPLIGQNESFIEATVERIIAEDWSARKVEQYVTNLKKTLRARAPVTTAIESRHEAKIVMLRERLNTPVDIRVNSRGGGQIVIKFKSDDELDRLQELLG